MQKRRAACRPDLLGQRDSAQGRIASTHLTERGRASNSSGDMSGDDAFLMPMAESWGQCGSGRATRNESVGVGRSSTCMNACVQAHV